MTSPKIAIDSNDSIVCLDSTIESTSDDDGNFTVSDFINVDDAVPHGVTPESFIILDETIDEPESEKEKEVVTVKKEFEEIEKPMFKVMFRDEAVARQYKKRVKDFLHRLIVAEDRKEDADSSDLVLEVWKKRSSRKRSCDHLDSESKIEALNSSGENDNLLFTIDKKPLMQNRLDVPTYGKKFDRVMDTSSGQVKPKEEDKPMAARPKMSCWNCLGNHSIRDCPQPRNSFEISKNRNEFQSRAPRCGRYHLEDDQSKYGHLVPGQISNELKRALGIRDHELPRHIYRMRILGYPPGWLKEARLQHSGMNLYDSDGERELDPMEEPGQIPEIGDKDQFDVNKLHDFPGFNVPSPSGTKEQEKNYWHSDQYSRHSKQSMLAMMREKKVDGYQRKKLKRNVETNSAHTVLDATSIVPCEMDVVEDSEDCCVIEDTVGNCKFMPPLPKSSPNPPLPPEPEDTATDSPKPVNSDLEPLPSPNNTDSPTLADLERRKKQLLDELENSNSPKSEPTTPVDEKPSIPVPPPSTKEDSEPEVAVETADPTSEVEETNNPTTPSRGSVKSVSLGTPILESTSPWNKLPSCEKFSKDVCDIINFENLPDSTGKYEQMTGILNKVRTTLATVQNNE